MALKLDRDRVPGFGERHPRVASALYQIGLCVMTFYIAITIGRYGPESEVPVRVERRCPNGAREDWFQLGFLEAYLCCADNCARMILTGGIGRNTLFYGLPFKYNIHRSNHPLPRRHYRAELP